jgi:hypothetical protein
VNKKTLSQAKNAMRCALDDLIDPPPSKSLQKALREYFANLCAYCGQPAIRREGHIDHADRNGGSGLGNLLLACKQCNGDEKREMAWDKFLGMKCAHDAAALAARHEKIRVWFETHPTTPEVLHPRVQAARANAEAAVAAYEDAYNQLRDALVACRTGE